MDEQRTCVITGAAGGIGRATATQMASRGFRVFAIVRNSDTSRAAVADIGRAVPDADVRPFFADLSSLHDVRAVAAAIAASTDRIDVLINNAGVYKRQRQDSVDGYEMTFAVNYLAPFLLTTELLPRLGTTPDSRIVNVTSALYRKGSADGPLPPPTDGFSGKSAYATSKRLLVQFTMALASRMESDGGTANCVHPGVVATDVFRDYPRLVAKSLNRFLSSPADGAQPVLHLATSSDLAGVTGAYFEEMTRKDVSPRDRDPALLDRLWGTSENLVARSGRD